MTNKKEDESEKPCKRDKETETTAKREKSACKERKRDGWLDREERRGQKPWGLERGGKRKKRHSKRKGVCVCGDAALFFQSLPLSFFPS